jgi:hypothetical protein
VAEAGCGSVSLGDPAIDRALPWNGLPRAFLHEFEHRPRSGQQSSHKLRAWLRNPIPDLLNSTGPSILARDKIRPARDKIRPTINPEE